MIQAGKKGLLASTLANRTVEPIGIDLDGVNDYGSLASDLTGNADGKTFTFSVWVYFDFLGGGNHFIYISGTGFIEISYQGGTGMRIRGFNSASSLILLATFSPPPIKTWTHMLISADLTNTSNRGVYLNDEAVSVTWTTYTDDIIDFTQSNHYIGSDSAGSNLMDGRLAGVYLDYTYRDLSTASNRRLFIDAEGFYVTPPTSGIISMPMDDPTQPYRNDGTGQDFTANGTVARSGRGPNQYNPAASTFDGSADYLSRSGLTGVADGKAATVAFWWKPSSFAVSQYFIDMTSGAFRVLYDDGDDRIEVLGTNSGFSTILNMYSTTGLFVVDKWYHIAVTFDLTNASNRDIQVNGVSVFDAAATYTNDDLDLTKTDYTVARGIGAFGYVSGELSDVWFDDSYTADLSGFYDTTTGKAKDLGVDGSTPTGSQPLIYLPLVASNPGDNRGTGGDFTVNT